MPDSAQAGRQRNARLAWAVPHSRHDRIIQLARRLLPVGIGVLAALMLTAPLVTSTDLSFVLSKDRVEIAKERLRVQAATYRGEDSNGKPFVLRAGSAVQASSREPVVKLRDLSGQILLDDGAAMITARQGRYDMDRERVSIEGPLRFRAANGYRLNTRDVDINMKDRTITSGGPVDGSLSLGRFSADHIHVNLPARIVVLQGRARLNIVQGAAR